MLINVELFNCLNSLVQYLYNPDRWLSHGHLLMHHNYTQNLLSSLKGCRPSNTSVLSQKHQKSVNGTSGNPASKAGSKAIMGGTIRRE
jgi:hypothetical protein